VSLIELPEGYDQLFSRVGAVTCSGCGKRPPSPGLCLLCGAVLCAGSDCCKTGGVGECTRHARSCGSGVGVFLLLHSSSVLLIHGALACYYPSPYLDVHGEEDIDLKRGRPLTLRRAR
jgi:hypothetical protein